MAVTSNIKRKKKSWVPMHAPKMLNDALLGETLVSDKKDVIGKVLTLNYSIFTKDMKKQNLDVLFKVISIVDDKAQTRIHGLSLTNSYVKRLVRRGKSKIEDSFTVKTNDGLNIRIKPLVITNNTVNSSLATKIRLLVKERLEKFVSSNGLDDLFETLLKQKIQKELKDELSKLYPLRYVDIRVAKVLSKQDQSTTKEE